MMRSSLLRRVLHTLIALSWLAATWPAQAAQTAEVTSQTFTPPAGYIVHGIHLNPTSATQGNGIPWYYDEITNYATAVGKSPAIVMYFRPWDRRSRTLGQGPCDDGYLPRYVEPGAPALPANGSTRMVMLTWEPLPILANPGPSAYDNIISGSYDDLIDQCATELTWWSGKTFLIRFMHEMNIPDSPWWAGHSYNQKTDGSGEGDTAKFIEAWRHVWQRVYDKQQAMIDANPGLGYRHNVQWVWAPNYASNPPDSWNDLTNYYPGDAYVDWIGLSGYNWMEYRGSGLQTYAGLYDATIQDLQCRYAKPIVHAEIGAAESALYPASGSPASKAAWITDGFTQMRTYPLVRAVVWFNDFNRHDSTSADFRVWTNTSVGYSTTPTAVSGAVTSAYAAQIGNAAYSTAFDATKLLNPPMTRCGSDVLSTDSVLGARPAALLVARVGQTTATLTLGALGFSAASTNFVVTSGCPVNATCRFSNNSTTSTAKTAPWGADTLTITASPTTALGQTTLTLSGAGTSLQVPLTVVAQLYPVFLPSMLRQ